MLLQLHERYPFAARAYSTVSKRQDFDLDSSILPKIWLAAERHGCRALQAVKFHDDVIKWKHFPRYWPFVWGIHRSPVNSPHKGQWRGAVIFSFICAWINGWVNNRTAGDLRRHRTHCDVIVMIDENHYIGDIWAIRRLKSQAFRLFYQQFCQAYNNEKNPRDRWRRPFYKSINQWIVDSPHKGPAMWKTCQCHDCISLLIQFTMNNDYHSRHSMFAVRYVGSFCCC